MRMGLLPGGTHVGFFPKHGKISAIANACAGQSGPLRAKGIVNSLVICPVQGFQYDVANGRWPAPFTERGPTFILHLAGCLLRVDPRQSASHRRRASG